MFNSSCVRSRTCQQKPLTPRLTGAASLPLPANRQYVAVTLPSAALDTAVLRKARGAFFIPGPAPHYVTDWPVRSLSETVPVPSLR